MPVFNEGALVEHTVSDVLSALSGETSFEIILVDDGSRDDTWHHICALSQQHPSVKGLRFTRNFGHQAALRAGLAHAAGRCAITMDADGEHPPASLPAFIAQWRNGAKVVQGLRADAAHLSFFKRITSKGFYRIFSWLAQTELRPGAADFRLLDRDVVDLLIAHPDASGFLRGFIPWAGYSTTFVEFAQGRRAAGVSRFTTGKMIGLARQGIIGFSVKPLRISMVVGLVTCLFALVNLVYALVMKLTSPDSLVPGWATLTGLIALLGGVQLVVLGILGEYIAVLFQTVRNQPTFIVEETKGFDPPA